MAACIHHSPSSSGRRIDPCRFDGGRFVLTASFELGGHEFTAINGGPEYKFTPAVSFMIPCDSQQEVDDYWSKLTAERANRVMQAMMTMVKIDIAALQQAYEAS